MLETERVKKGWSQRKLSKVSGVSQSYISKLENECFTHSPTLKQVIALALALDIDPKLLSNSLIDKEMNSKDYQNMLKLNSRCSL